MRREAKPWPLRKSLRYREPTALALEHPRLAAQRALRQEPAPIAASWDASMLLVMGDGTGAQNEMLGSRHQAGDATALRSRKSRPASAPSTRPVQTLRMSSYQHPRNAPLFQMSSQMKPVPKSIEVDHSGVSDFVDIWRRDGAVSKGSSAHMSIAAFAHNNDAGKDKTFALTECATGKSAVENRCHKAELIKVLRNQGWSCRQGSATSVCAQRSKMPLFSDSESFPEERWFPGCSPKAVLQAVFDKAIDNINVGNHRPPRSREEVAQAMLRVRGDSSVTCHSSASAGDGSCSGAATFYSDDCGKERAHSSVSVDHGSCAVAPIYEPDEGEECEPQEHASSSSTSTDKQTTKHPQESNRQLIQQDSCGDSSDSYGDHERMAAISSVSPLTRVDIRFGSQICSVHQSSIAQKPPRPASAGAHPQSSWSGTSGIGNQGFSAATPSGGFASAKRPCSTRPWSAPPHQQSRSDCKLAVMSSSAGRCPGAALRDAGTSLRARTWIQPPRFVASRPASPSMARLLACAGGKPSNTLIPCHAPLQPFVKH